MRHLLVMLLATLACWAAACDRADGEAGNGPGATGPSKYPYTVATTVGMVTDIVRQVGGDKAHVTGIVGEGVDPHLYKPTPSDVRSLLDADVVFYSGLMLEGKMTDSLVKLARDGKPVFAVTELIDESYLLTPEGFQGHHDPHVWMDVSGWMRAVEAVAQSLGRYDPPNAAEYRSRAEQYLVELRDLHEYGRRAIGSIPTERRVLITAHDAFNYFGRAYGIEVKGIQGISTESEAGLQDLNRLVQEIVDKDIRAVFTETSVSEKNVRALIDGARARGKDVRPAEKKLFSDAMGAPGTYEGTYVGMLDHNITVITRALGGDAPERGMNGKLAQ